MIKHPFEVGVLIVSSPIEAAEAYTELFRLAVEKGIVMEKEYCGVDGCGKEATRNFVTPDGVEIYLCKNHINHIRALYPDGWDKIEAGEEQEQAG